MSWLINANALHIPLADQSVHMCVTSPPYWGLRSYSGTGQWVGGDPECDHAVREDPHLESSTLQGGKMTVGHQQEGYKDYCRRCGAIRVDNQLGLERTPEEYVANMVAVFREVWRVLRDDGTCWLNLGDSYAGGGYTNSSGGPSDKQSSNRGAWFEPREVDTGLKPKDLVGIPWRVAFALQADGWYLRSDIIWSKPNPMPESVMDRPTKAHEYLFLLAKSQRYFYDAESVREPIKDVTLKRLSQPNFENQKGGPKDTKTGNRSERRTLENLKERYTKQGVWDERQEGYANWDKSGGRNKRTVWTIATAPYSGAHFATYPPALVEPCIKAGTSERGVCPKCGKPWERVSEKVGEFQRRWSTKNADGSPYNKQDSFQNIYKQTGWRPTCTCDAGDPIPATVLDPFVGSGTTLLVARQLGRRGVGLDLSYSYLHDQARKRLSLDALDAWANGIAANDNGYHDLPMFAEAIKE